MAYMKMLSARKVASEDARSIMRDGVRNAGRDRKTEAAEGFFSEAPERFADFDVTSGSRYQRMETP